MQKIAIQILAVLILSMGSVSAHFLQKWNPSHSIGTITGNYNFSYNQTPDQLVELQPAAIPNTGLTYEWQSSPTPMISDFVPIPVNGGNSSYSFPGQLTQTMYYMRKTTSAALGSIFSNIIKITVVSVNWEDLNYIRSHGVTTTAITSWQTVDQLPIGQKFQTTNYLDGLGRSVEKVSRETATPAVAGGQWGDKVQFSQYDQFGRQPISYLPYTTTTQSGKFKSAPLTEQPQYYTNTYSETYAYNEIVFDNSPANRVTKVKEPGLSWHNSNGNAATYDVNTPADNVQIWTIGYVQGNAPVSLGAYPGGTLYKLVTQDVNGAQVVEYTNTSGQLILKKIQLDAVPSAAHAGWICTYSIYDDFGLLRMQIQPEGVKYLDANSWTFAGTNGPAVLAEQCFQYNFDDKGRTIRKKAPGAVALNLLYDLRDRPVFLQDGNQAVLATPQWTANLYDELDRPVMTALYNTAATISSLQTDINNSVTVATVNIPAYTQAAADLSYDNRNTSISTYTASNSISFIADGGGNFQSGANDQFVAMIDPSPSSPAYSGTVTTLGSPISSANLGNASVTTIIKYLYYDNYAFTGVKSFDNNFTNTTAYSTSDANVLPISASNRTLGFPTGSRIRILGTSTFLSATNYYDEKGNHIQSLEDNIKAGVDIITLQYHFDGRTLSSCSSHTASGTGYTAFTTLDKYIFDKLGRVVSIQKQMGSNASKTIGTYDYDDMGRIKTKHLDPGYNNINSGVAELEALNYSFNIHNQITGINKDYALKASGTYNKWGHFFGFYLGYDNKDNVFAAAQLNGQVGGQLWSTQGDDAQRRYDYTYDNAGRLVNAVYKEQRHPGDGWSNSTMDFSVSGTSGQITYDLNGNLLTMLQKGVMPGTAAPITIDDLRYIYGSFSNKLTSVTDQMTATGSNGLSGDFKDGANAAGTPDYVYDANGNMVIDLNKNVQSLNNGAAGTNGISYNFLDKPEQIRIVGKGTIKIVYSANGDKLQRVFIPESGSSTITTYINGFVYQETATLTLSSPAPFSGTGLALSYINFEEGRIRVMTPANVTGLDPLVENGNLTLPNGKTGAWDYFVLDFQHNVRMILTEETHSAGNTCTMETARATAEDPVFGQTGAGNEVETTRFAKPTGWTNNATTSVSQLGRLAGHMIGPNTLQKVMAGDLVTATAQYYYQSGSTGTNPNIIPNILSSLGGAIAGGSTAGTLAHGNAANITSQLGSNTGFVTAVEPNSNTSGTPQAYLTILFFDERFNFIAAADGGLAQAQVASTWSTSTPALGLTNIKAPRNGYAFIYVSNRSDQDVYFDNMTVGIAAGNIIEENHYYAYGLKIAGLSSKKLGDAGEGNLKNNYLYNDKELFDDGDLNWYDYGFRNYDPQIGRFPQLDPLTDDYPFLTPYQYASNDPITNIDVDGLEGLNAVGTAKDFTYGVGAVDAFRSFILPSVRQVTSAVSAAASGLSDVGKGLTIAESLTNIIVKSAIVVGNIINTSVTTNQAGITQTQQQPPKLKDRPGAAYGSSDAAAVGWSRLYGTASLDEHIEFSSIIYKVKNKYYFTPYKYFDDRTVNMVSSPSIKQTLEKEPGIVPKGAEIEGNVHSHPWIAGNFGERNYTFSNNNVVGAIKYRDDEKIMADDATYTYYMYNSLGQVRARRPSTPYNSDPNDDIIAEGLPWDPNSTVADPRDPTKPHKKLGPYHGKWETTKLFDGGEHDSYPIHP